MGDMKTDQTMRGPFKKCFGSPVKQSNFGRYKTVVSRGQSDKLEMVSITANTKELVEEVASIVDAAPKLLEALILCRDQLKNYRWHVGESLEKRMPADAINGASYALMISEKAIAAMKGG